MTKHVRRSHSFDLERLKSMVLEAQGLGFSLNEDVGGMDGRCPLFARRCGINNGENLIPAVTAHGSARAPRRGILRSLFHVCDEILRCCDGPSYTSRTGGHHVGTRTVVKWPHQFGYTVPQLWPPITGTPSHLPCSDFRPRGHGPRGAMHAIPTVTHK